MNEDEPRRSKGHCKQSGTGSWQSVITLGIFLSRCVRAHPVTHLYLYTKSQHGPIPWPWAALNPVFIACLFPVNRKQAEELPVKLLLVKVKIFSSVWNPGHWTWMMWSNSAYLGGERATCQLAAQVSLRHPRSVKPTVPSLFSRCHCYISQGWIFLSMVIQWEWTINPFYLWIAMNLRKGLPKNSLLSLFCLLNHVACPLKTLEFQYICYTLFFMLNSPLGLSCHPLFQTPININL